MAYRVAAFPGSVEHADLGRLIWAQRWRRGIAWALIAALPVGLVLGGAWLAAAHGLWALVVGILNLLVLGGIGWGYLAWWISSFASGQMSTPSVRWRVEVTGREVRVCVGGREARFSLDEVEGAVWVVDGGWERLKAIEDTLVVKLAAGVLRIPDCATGLGELRQALAHRGLMTTKWIGD